MPPSKLFLLTNLKGNYAEKKTWLRSASDVDMLTAADGAVETRGLRMACQSAGKSWRRPWHHPWNAKVKESPNRRESTPSQRSLAALSYLRAGKRRIFADSEFNVHLGNFALQLGSSRLPQCFGTWTRQPQLVFNILWSWPHLPQPKWHSPLHRADRRLILLSTMTCYWQFLVYSYLSGNYGPPFKFKLSVLVEGKSFSLIHPVYLTSMGNVRTENRHMEGDPYLLCVYVGIQCLCHYSMTADISSKFKIDEGRVNLIITTTKEVILGKFQ
jgi:hypothetical protein